MLNNFLKKDVQFSYPLNTSDAATGEILKEVVPEERLYRLGPFYCDTSPDTHHGRFLNAIDFIVRDGSYVHAARGGILIDVVEEHDVYGDDPSYADSLNYVTIDHEDGLFSQYAHLEKGSVQRQGVYVGKRVVRGQVIGVVGKTGWVNFEDMGDHLHFMVFRELRNSFESVPVTFYDD